MKTWFSFILLFLYSILSNAQTSQQLIKEDAPNIYISCSFCDFNFIKEKIPLVNYVNDRNDADVHIVVTSQRTGSGGTEYTMFFYGQNKFHTVNDTLSFNAAPAEAQDLIRDKSVETLKLGLIRYISRSTSADQLIISFKKTEQRLELPKDDWDFWVFSSSIMGNFNGEKQSNYLWLNGSISASRVTEQLKLRFNASSSYNENNFEFFSGENLINIKSISRNQSFNASSYFSINQHWSWGFSGGAFNSTYSNIALSTRISPEIEYNFFPYSESNKRQLRVNYKISPTFQKYDSETIFFKTRETLVSQQLSATLSLVEQWGTTNLSISGANFFHDMNKYELQLYSSVSWQLFKGFSLSVYGGYTKIRNQISLPRGSASIDEVLLRRRILETGYSYWGGFGISYSFGSIYNNIVNPRFGSGGGSTIIISN